MGGRTGPSQSVDFVHGGYARGRIASFVGYFPADDPQLVMLIVLDEPQTTKWGGTAAAPVFRAIAVAAAERLGIRIDSPQAVGNHTDGTPATGPATKPSPDRPTSVRGLFVRAGL